MPRITPDLRLTWNPPYQARSELYGQSHIKLLKWRLPGARPGTWGAELPENQYLYIIENANGQPVYAGEADDVRDRFVQRQNALRELGLDPAIVVANYMVRIASVDPSGQLLTAEHWLVRRLVLNDLQNNPRVLQNINLTNKVFTIRSRFAIQNAGSSGNDANRPAYLNRLYRYNPGDTV